MALTIESALRKDRTTSATLEHRHFAFIASTLAACKPDPAWAAETDQWRTQVNLWCRACSGSNPRFDRDRFLRACGVE